MMQTGQLDDIKRQSFKKDVAKSVSVKHKFAGQKMMPQRTNKIKEKENEGSDSFGSDGDLTDEDFDAAEFFTKIKAIYDPMKIFIDMNPKTAIELQNHDLFKDLMVFQIEGN